MLSYHDQSSMTHAGMVDNFPVYPGNHENKLKGMSGGPKRKLHKVIFNIIAKTIIFFQANSTLQCLQNPSKA